MRLDSRRLKLRQQIMKLPYMPNLLCLACCMEQQLQVRIMHFQKSFLNNYSQYFDIEHPVRICRIGITVCQKTFGVNHVKIINHYVSHFFCQRWSLGIIQEPNGTKSASPPPPQKIIIPLKTVNILLNLLGTYSTTQQSRYVGCFHHSVQIWVLIYRGQI